MRANAIKWNTAVRTLCYLYTGILCFLCLSNFAGGVVNWLNGTILVVFAAALFVRRPILDQILATAIMLGGCYMIMAVIYAYGHGMEKGHIDAATRVIRVGGTIFLLCFFSGCALLGIAIFSPVKK